VLAHEPDLCFVEFVSRDAAAPQAPAWVGPAAEGIVLKLLARGCMPCFLYLYRADEHRGVFGEVRKAYEEVAAHYGVASIDVATHFRSALASGSVALDAILRDEVHTFPLGAELAAEHILEEVRAIPSGPAPPLPPAPLHRDNMSNTRMVAATEVAVRDPREAEHARFRFFYDSVVIEQGNRFECAFDGELLGLLIVLGPATSAVRIAAGADAHEVTLRDAESYYERLSTLTLERPIAPGMAATIEPVEARDDAWADADWARTPPQLKVIGFLVRP
jgi:hypothetical protein